MTRYAMVADLDRCVGCQTCTAACRHANATAPAVQWRKVLDIEHGVYPSVSRTFVPVGCQHCEDPPCMHVCPTTATRKRSDGIVTIDYDLCIGCAYCDVACPYQARFKVSAPRHAYGSAAMAHEALREDPRRIGVAQKCTFCADRIDAGLAEGLVPGVDAAATPACVNACIADALAFGDLEDPSSNVSRLVRERPNFRMHEEVGTQPGFHYLYDRHTQNVATDAAAQAGATYGHGAEPWHQEHWDWKASCNFLLGGAGTGLLAVAAAAGVPLARVPLVLLGSLALAALGLSILMFKIGRPARFLNVFLQPQRSWMSREAWIAAALFPVGALAAWSGSMPLAYVAAALGLAFLFAQAMILYEAKGIPAWRAPRLVAFMVSTGLAEGAALLTLLAAALPALAGALPAAAGALVLFVLLRLVGWHWYLRGMEGTGAPVRALEVLRRSGRQLVLWGGVLPLALAVLAFAVPPAAAAALGLGAVPALLAGSFMKFVLITRAGYNQGYALRRTSRGGGAAPAIKPGWASPASLKESS
jgi:phenylacetyl-CoA:acceptor oxidoreductase subunit 1